MRRAIAQEKGETDHWDLKYASGGMVDIDFIAQYLQLVHAHDKPDILDVGTVQVLENAARLGVLPHSEVEILRAAARLYHDLTQILRLCVSDRFKPETAGSDLQRVMARAGDAPDFSSLEARVKETQSEVRRVFSALLEGSRLLERRQRFEHVRLEACAAGVEMREDRALHPRIPELPDVVGDPRHGLVVALAAEERADLVGHVDEAVRRRHE